MEDITKLRGAMAKRQHAQDRIMDGIGNVLGYWTESLSNEELDGLGEDGIREMQEILQAQADRVAKMFGYEKAWKN